eukprot:g2891.t1
MASRDDAVKAAQETARLGVSTVVESVAEGIIEIGASTPVVAPLCKALLKAKGVVDAVSRNKEELEELEELEKLYGWCELIAVQLIDKAKASTSLTFGVDSLHRCFVELKAVAERYRKKRWWARLVHFRKDGEDIRKLRARIDAEVRNMGLAVSLNNAEVLEDVRRIVDRVIQPRPEVAPVPKKAPVTKSSHVVRKGVVDRVCKILGGDGGPAVAALTGPSGAGKTTAAAAMVGERGDRVRALFSHGVVWLRVGKGAVAADRLPCLMLKLAKRLHQDVMKGGVDAPEVGEDGGSYVNKILSQEKLKCLVVADDVWENEVVEKLRATGMWVLLTTRFPEFVEPQERVVMDTLTETEAEDVIRRAAELPSGDRLCDAATEVLKICGRVAMDTAFVGNLVRELNTISNKAWVNAVKEIEAQGGGVDVGRDENRLAILRAGFEYFGTWVQKLYMMLTVFPDGHAFGESDAAVLVDGDVATHPISILESMYGVCAKAAGRMEDAEEWFRKALTAQETGGLTASYQAVFVLVELGLCSQKAGRVKEAEACYERALEIEEAQLGPDDLQVAVTRRDLGRCLWEAGRPGDAEPLLRRALEIKEAKLGLDDIQVAYTLHELGACMLDAGKYGEAEPLLRRSLEIKEAKLGFNDPQVAYALHQLGVCVRASEKYGEAEALFRRALGIKEAKLGPDDVGVAVALHQLGVCMRASGKYGEAEALLRRSLEIEEANSGPDHPRVAYPLHELGVCALEEGRPGGAEALLRRSLEIREAKLGPDDVQVAWTLHELARSVRKAGRPGDAVPLFERVLVIEEAKLGTDDVDVGRTLHSLGVCALEEGRPGDAVPLFERALAIFVDKLGADDLQVGYTQHRLGVCMREAGRPGDAVPLFRRALEIEETKLGPDDPKVIVTRSVLARCVEEGGRPAATE